ncbi:MAG: FecR domain-containing protein, partial [Candidatus Methylomirabilales bacterium]
MRAGRGRAIQRKWNLAATQVWLCLFALLLPLPASAKPAAVGVVTGLLGRVELTRRPAPAPVALQFRDDLFLRDIIDTHEKSMARMLFGGRSTVTVRELTRFEVRAEVLPSGATRTVYDLADGKIRVIVAPKLMRRGDQVEIRTPNAVAGIRGTVVIAEHNRKTGRSRFTVLQDCATVTPRGRMPLKLCQGATVSMTSSRVESVRTVTTAEAAQLQAEFAWAPPHPQEPNRERILEAQVRTGQALMTAVVGTVTGQPTPISVRPTAAEGVTSDPRTAG